MKIAMGFIKLVNDITRRKAGNMSTVNFLSIDLSSLFCSNCASCAIWKRGLRWLVSVHR